MPPTAPSESNPPHVLSTPPRRRRTGRLVLAILILAGLIWQRQLTIAPFLHARARQALSEYRPQAALVWTDWVQTLHAETATTALLRAQARRQQGEMRQVATALKQAEELGADSKLIWRQRMLSYAQSGQMRRAEPYLATLLTDRSQPSTEVSDAFVIGYTRTQQFDKALSILQAWIADTPTHFRPYLLRGRIYFLSLQYSDAEQDYRRACELSAQRPEIAFELAETLHKLNRHDEAIEYYQQGLNSSAQAALARAGLAISLKVQGQHEAALQQLITGFEQHPKQFELALELGRMQLELGQYPEAITALERAVELRPRDDEAHYLLAQALVANDQADQAQPHLEYVQQARAALEQLTALRDEINDNPRNVQALIAMAKIHLEYGEPQEGVIHLLTALDVDPQNREARELLAQHQKTNHSQ